MTIQGKNLELLSGLLGAAQKRQEVLMNNLANAETPGWVRKTVRFEELLRDAMQSESFELGKVRPEIVEDTQTPGRADGNNVHLEHEMNAIRENQLLYQTYAAILGGQFSALQAAIQEG